MRGAKRYLMNSAVIPEPGLYRYTLMSLADARVWIHAGAWESRIGYAATARYIQRTLGVQVPLSREVSRMKTGDEALVVRLTFRLQDIETRRQQPQFDDEDWEIGLLLRLE